MTGEEGSRLFWKTVAGIVLTLLLASMVALRFCFQPATAETGTVYIRADGSVDPPIAPISTLDNVTYTLTGDIISSFNGLVIERNNIIVDGDGHTLQGSINGIGIWLSGREKVTVRNTRISAFDCGILLCCYSNNNIIVRNNITKSNYGIKLGPSSNNSVSGNIITVNNYYGIWFYSSSNYNSLSENIVANNYCGIFLSSSSNNRFWHNSFIDNTLQVYDENIVTPSDNTWDDGYPSGGNYWSNYTSADSYTGPFQNETGSDGIGDTPYVIDTNNLDRYPLMNPHAPQPDVVIMNISPSKTVVGLDYSLSISVTAANLGGYTETFSVTSYANATLIGTQEITASPSGNSAQLVFMWNTTGFAYGNYTLSATADTVPGETDTSNNNYTCPIPVHVGVPGDVSGPTQGMYDGTTNMRDIQYMIILFNTKPTSPNWNPNADVNNDGIANMRDIQIAILNFNKHE